MRWMPRLRMLLARHPWIYWLTVFAVAGALALSVTAALAEVRRERESWGESVTVFVSTTAISIGDPIATSVETRQVPLAMVPAEALQEIPDAAVAAQRVSAGEIVVGIDVSAGRGPLALLPDGWLAIFFESPVNETFSVGDSASVLAGGEMIAPDAIIIQILADGVVVGVPAGVAPAVAASVSQRLAVIALSSK